MRNHRSGVIGHLYLRDCVFRGNAEYFLWAEKAFGLNITNIFKNVTYVQVPFSSCLDAVPRCGGAMVRVTEENIFMTALVILVYLLFEHLNALSGLNPEAMFNTVGVLLLIAVLVGFIPGCGPRIPVTTFCIHGLIPFSALIGNSVANDGDALFPASALPPKAAMVASIYSAIPPFIIAYGFYFFAIGFPKGLR